jgi:hypothetical protein
MAEHHHLSAARREDEQRRAGAVMAGIAQPIGCLGLVGRSWVMAVLPDADVRYS